MKFRFCRPAHVKVMDFRQGRVRQTDDEFIAECDLPDDPTARKIALAVRRAVANVGLVDSQFIHVNDNFPGTLSVLPIWESMDWLEFMLQLEEELGQAVPDINIFHPSPSITVREMFAEVYEILMMQSDDPNMH